ncbi:MAG TPA: UDP-N-acetylglucosamine--N-acetylmuramyl-(pentapeptide) pyrophosphoryl-undecaprenol N-acetylglucosamine transferase, partial [bacterium]|nr:UDP-N-acetylglucosamine--N-acetylmuramyl-(pentapeptide) pyrophosphoryl-undecaprenol N-acetylglucosamine transferase [bacterium]
MNLLLTGGGTGGHVYPALALAEALRRRDPSARVAFAGSRAGMEATLVPASGVPFVGLRVRPPRGRSLPRTAASLVTGALSLWEAVRLVRRFRPDAIVATGGIAAAPVVIVGAALRVPVVIVEGNVLPGRINRVLARWCRAAAVAWDDAVPLMPARRVIVTGLPIRREVCETRRADGLREFGLASGRHTVLVLGGSQGASPLNAAVEDAVERLRERRDIQVLHQVGGGWTGAAGAREDRTVGGVRYVRVPYVEHIGAAYASADLVVSRCGATALAEITAAGLPAILAPYRYAADDHQARNAEPLVRAGAASVI